MPKNILTILQKQVLEIIFKDPWFRQYFYLTGGTALSAFHLFHRYSDDLDFFCHIQDLTPLVSLIDAISKKIKKPFQQLHKTPGFLRYKVDELKIDFVCDVPYRIGSPELINDFMVDCLHNIAVNKVCAILGRLDIKDYVDLYFIQKQHHYDIFELLSLGQRKDTGLDAFTWASLIGDIEHLQIYPRMIKKIEHKELKIFFFNLRDLILDKINPSA